MVPNDFSAGDLIPALPDEVSELCLLHLPFPYPSLLRSVSSTWNRTLSNPSFFTTKSSLFLTKPYFLSLATDTYDLEFRWLCLDPVSKNWHPLPPMPIPDAEMEEADPSSLECSVNKEKGEIYVFGGRSEKYVMVYSAATNSWRTGKCSMKPSSNFFASAAIDGKVFALSGDEIGDADGVFQVQCYDPALDSSINIAEGEHIIDRYDAAVIGKKIYLAAAWPFPLDDRSYGRVYDTELNTWQDMPVGMSKGWTGTAATVGHNLFVFSEIGDIKVKVYDHVSDTWLPVGGSEVPEIAKQHYYALTADGENRKIYVVGKGLNVAIGTLTEIEKKKWEIEWEVIKAPDARSQFLPSCSCLILHA